MKSAAISTSPRRPSSSPECCSCCSRLPSPPSICTTTTQWRPSFVTTWSTASPRVGRGGGSFDRYTRRTGTLGRPATFVVARNTAVHGFSATSALFPTPRDRRESATPARSGRQWLLVRCGRPATHHQPWLPSHKSARAWSPHARTPKAGRNSQPHRTKTSKRNIAISNDHELRDSTFRCIWNSLYCNNMVVPRGAPRDGNHTKYSVSLRCWSLDANKRQGRVRPTGDSGSALVHSRPNRIFRGPRTRLLGPAAFHFDRERCGGSGAHSGTREVLRHP